MPPRDLFARGRVKKFLERRLILLWGTPTGACQIALYVAAVAAAPPLLAGKITGGAIFGLLTGLGCLALWKITNRLPRIEDGKVGVLIAIVATDEDERERVHEDFVLELRGKLLAESSVVSFQVVALSGYWANVAMDGQRTRDILEASRAQIVFFGRARRREVQGKQTHILNIETALRHAPVSRQTSEDLTEAMEQTLPKHLRIPVDGDALTFEVASQWYGLGAKFLAAVALAFAGNLAGAERLLLELEQHLTSHNLAPGLADSLTQQVRRYIIIIYTNWIAKLYDHYVLRRDKSILEPVDALCDKLIARSKAHVGHYMPKAICAFVFKRDVTGARALVNRAMLGDRSIESVGQFSLAFLLAYEGKLKLAFSAYLKAFKHPPTDRSVAIQCEEFIQLVMDEEPSKRYLLFCTALINFHMKSDFSAAAQDAREFLSLPTHPSGEWAREKMEKLLSVSEKTMPTQEAYAGDAAPCS